MMMMMIIIIIIIIIIIRSPKHPERFLRPKEPPLSGCRQHFARHYSCIATVREAERLSVSSAEVKNPWSFTSTSPDAFISWCLLVHNSKFYLSIIMIVIGPTDVQD